LIAKDGQKLGYVFGPLIGPPMVSIAAPTGDQPSNVVMAPVPDPAIAYESWISGRTVSPSAHHKGYV
jgi:hypothetical protein